MMITLTGKAQFSDLVIYCKRGDLFYVYLNGIQQNEVAAPIVKITNLPAPNYKLYVAFSNPRYNSIEKELFIQQGVETNYLIKKDKNDEFKILFISEVPRIIDTVNLNYRQIVKYSNEPLHIRKDKKQNSEKSAKPATEQVAIEPETGKTEKKEESHKIDH